MLLGDGRIEAVGRDVRVPDGVERVDATGKVVLPGLVDAHVHLGVHSEGDGWAGQDTNELTDPVTPARPGAGRHQPGRPRLRRRGGRRGPDRERQPRVGQPDRRPGGRHPHRRPHRRRDGPARPQRHEVGPRGEPKAGLRRAQAAALHPPGHGRGDPRRPGQGGQLPGQARPRRRPAGRAGPALGGARPGPSGRDPLAAALPPGRRHRHRPAPGRRVRLPPGHRPRHRGRPARRPAGRAGRARPHRPPADLPLQGRAAQPLPGQPRPPGRRRRRAGASSPTTRSSPSTSSTSRPPWPSARASTRRPPSGPSP